MTRRSGLAHARAELQAKVKTWMAGALFTQQDTWLSRRIKRLWAQIARRKITILNCATTTMSRSAS